MTDDNSILEALSGESTRRSVLKSGALATAGAGLSLSGVGGAAAQAGDGGDGGDVLDDQEWDKAIMPVSQFRPSSRFAITSPVIRWNPNVQEIRDNVWSEYNTRTIRYLNDSEQILFWQAHNAEVPDYNQEAGYVVDAEGDTGPNGTPQPEIFRMRSEGSILGDSGYVTVQFTPVGEDEEDSWLDNDDWWYDDEDQITLDDEGLVDGTGGNATNATGGNATGGNATNN